MLAFVLAHLLVALVLPVVARRSTGAAFAIAAVPPAAALVWVLARAGAVLGGEVSEQRVPWAPSLGLELTFRLDPLALLIALLAVPTTLWGLCLALLAAGSFITPQSTAHSVAIEIAAPQGTATEAFGWVVTSVTLGSAIGQSASGQLVELSGPPTSFATASAVGLVLAAVLWFRRRRLVPATSRSDVGLAGV